MEVLLPSSVFSYQLSCSDSGSAVGDIKLGWSRIEDYFGTSSILREQLLSGAVFEELRHALTQQKCRRCSKGAVFHNLKVRWRRPLGAQTPEHRILSLGALLEATRVFSCSEVFLPCAREWRAQLVAGCWRSGFFFGKELWATSKACTALTTCADTLTVGDAGGLVSVLETLDNVLFSLYYDLKSKAFGEIPWCEQRHSPDQYFERVEYGWNSKPTRSLDWLKQSEIKRANSLLRLWSARMREHVRIGVRSIALVSGGQLSRRVPENNWQGQGRPPVSSAKAQRWHDALRDWAAHIYAYAVPCESALDLIAKQGTIVEVGAGTGFWATLLRGKGCDIVAADSAPLLTAAKLASSKKKSRKKAVVFNEYHGQLPAYTTINPMVAVKGPQKWAMRLDWTHRDCLLLCYPPPGERMALDALQEFQGRCVAVVGEWCGTTGTAEFEIELNRCFDLVAKEELPNFPNTAFELSVWHRRPKPLTGDVPHLALVCSGCKSPLGVGKTRLFRSALSRSPQSCWCSRACHNGASHNEMLELRRRGFHLEKEQHSLVIAGNPDQDIRAWEWVDEIPWPYTDADPSQGVVLADHASATLKIGKQQTKKKKKTKERRAALIVLEDVDRTGKKKPKKEAKKKSKKRYFTGSEDDGKRSHKKTKRH